MITLTTHYNMQINRVIDAVQDAEVRTFSRAAGRIRKSAIASIDSGDRKIRVRDSKGRFKSGGNNSSASPPGTPPHTHKGKRLPKAILFAADKFGAVIGPARTKFGTAGQAHELGGTYKGQDFDERPFMFPALESEAPAFAGSWLGSVGG